MMKLKPITGLLIAILISCYPSLYAADFRTLSSQVNIESIKANSAYLAQLGTRVSGYQGCDRAAEFIYQKFTQAGLKNVTSQTFQLPMPIDKGANLKLQNKNFKLYPLWPNLLRTSSLPKEGLTGELIYVGDAELTDFNYKPVKDSIVLINFNCETNWLNAPLLGAKAVIFIEPTDTMRGEAEQKFLKVPVDFPRFWLPRNAVDPVLDELQKHPTTAKINCRMDWENRAVKNIIGILPGTDPQLSKEAIILHAYYDSISVVPSLSPGADQASSIAAFLQIIAILTKNPPKRSVIFLATPGHFEALAGTNEFIHLIGPEWERKPKYGFGERIANFFKRLFGRPIKKHEPPRLEAKEKEIKRLKAKIQKLSPHLSDGSPRATTKTAPTTKTLKQREYKKFRLRQQLRIAGTELKLLKILYQYKLPLFISIDLSSQSPQMGVFQASWYYQTHYLMRFFSPIGTQLHHKYGPQIGRALSLDINQHFVDGINPTQDRDWKTYFPGKMALDCEISTRYGRPGIAFTTTNDHRPHFNTPLDTLDKVEFQNLELQTKLTLCFSLSIFNDPELHAKMLKRLKKLRNEMKLVKGSVLEFVRRKSFLPNTPVPNSLVLVQGAFKSMMGVHPDVLAIADDEAKFSFIGEMNYPERKLEAYHINPATGEIDYAPDLGPEGEQKYPRTVEGRGERARPIIVFPCQSLAIFDLVDQRYFETLEQIFLYDARNDSEPLSFGYSLPLTQLASAGELPSYVEPCAVVFSPPDTHVKITMGMGLIGLRMILINATPAEPNGKGFPVTKIKTIPFTSFQAAQDMWQLDESRMTNLERHGIINLRLRRLHNWAKSSLDKAKKFLKAQKYDKFIAYARHGWGCESRAYPDVQGTANDVVKGVLFYLAMLLPFAFFMERLVFAFPDIKRRIISTFGIFFVVFMLLRYVHPAFEITFTPFVILLAFIILALAIIVIAIVTVRFNDLIKSLKEELTGVHEADVGRISAAASAFSLGISNMRRRKARTILTCATLILLTFTILSCTSVRSFLKLFQRGLARKPAYTGLMIRDKIWDPLESPTYRILANEYGKDQIVAPRAWYSSLDIQRRALIDITCKTKSNKTYIIHAILGLHHLEDKVTNTSEILLPGGRWFKPGELYTCILSQTAAKFLEIESSDVNKVDLELFSLKFKVIGIYRDKSLEKIKDLDGESIIPVDYALLKPEVVEEIKRQQQRNIKFGATTSPTSFLLEYTHFRPEYILLLPYDMVMNLGGTLRSVAIKFKDAKATKEAVDRLMKRFALNIYVGTQNKSYIYSSVGMTLTGGLEALVILIVIAALIILNTMLGAVYERTKEIGIYSSIGLAPVHVAALFLAESCVYANIGAVAGYLIGQGVVKVLPELNILAGLALNYSSQSAVGVTAIVMLVVLLSTLYPAKKASEMAVPEIERRWKMPEPEDDLMFIKLPFTLSGEDPKPCSYFLKEFFDAHVDYTGGDFCTDKVDLQKIATDYGEGYAVNLRMWLAPYDLGVSQDLRLLISPTEEEHVYEITIKLHREAGDIPSWKKTNWFFLNSLRKQFLIWRTIKPSQKIKYAQEADKLLAIK